MRTADSGPGAAVALPVAEEPAELPPAAEYHVLHAIEAAAAVGSGLAASIDPMVYQDLVAWVQAQLSAAGARTRYLGP